MYSALNEESINNCDSASDDSNYDDEDETTQIVAPDGKILFYLSTTINIVLFLKVD